MSQKRKVQLAIISDVHLGTYGCHATELLRYLKSIRPEILIINGDFIDIWQFSKRYWPKSHMRVVKYIMGMLSKGVKIYYNTGNHDELLRKFKGFRMGNFRIVNKVVLELDGRKAWIFHGDVFDVVMQHSKWLAKLGAKGYDLLILINRMMNFFSEKLGRGKISLSKKVKNSVKSAVKFINDFEQTAAEIGIEEGYDYVVCGHIHQPEMRSIHTAKGGIMYLNSGDWIENLTSLEYNNGEWSIYRYGEDELAPSIKLKDTDKADLNAGQLFDELLSEFKIARA